jgi:TonB family protein
VEAALESVLQQRSDQLAGWLNAKRSLLMSSVLHVILFASFILVPLLTRGAPEPIEFTPITIVPVQALGVEEPISPAPRAEAPPAEPRPEPTPEPVANEPKPQTPALPEPESRPVTREQRPPTPTSQPAEPETKAAPDAGALGQRQGSALGSSLGTSAFGATVGGLDNPDFVYGYYVDQMLAMIGSQWQRPALGAEIEAVIHFRIHTDGHITDLRVLQSSGYNSYDLAGLRAVQHAAPFPKLPQSFRHKSLGVNLILR